MPSQTYKEPRVCDCGYTTNFPSAWCVHRKSCKLVKCEKDVLIEQMKQQLAAKDRQIEQLIKRPRTVNNTNNNTTNNRYV
eukprot:4899370-Prymnesium_polylepis.1